MGVFLRFPEREGIGWNLPNTKNALTTSKLQQWTMTLHLVIADGKHRYAIRAIVLGQ